ncbi:HAD family hydrolase [Limibaculum sp. FT325]|uniref:HAD family hydrolase n=1 Tax=Thermohalobaculum sediminis TaxID=2939436 RepID=UPI0020BEE4CE|nr:HAD family hydrolase [Limibaculum sediminis]MCL5776781.1 HAD family hydrolase [Limibaculum sediminis]
MPRPRRMPVAGILFDKDGTLFDFQATWAGVVEMLLDDLAPAPADRAAMASDAGYDAAARRFLPGSPIVAGATAETAAIWARHRPDLGARVIEEMANAAALAVARRPGGLVTAAPDLPGLLDGLAARGLALGVATHDTEEGARVQLGAAGALDRFAFIAGYDSGHALKPAPAMLLAFARQAGIAPECVIMVGDSRHDLEMVPAAGAAFAVGVLTGPATAEDLAPHADHILPSIAALPALLDSLA